MFTRYVLLHATPSLRPSLQLTEPSTTQSIVNLHDGAVVNMTDLCFTGEAGTMTTVQATARCRLYKAFLTENALLYL